MTGEHVALLHVACENNEFTTGGGCDMLALIS
jgi:hypothetical protein